MKKITLLLAALSITILNAKQNNTDKKEKDWTFVVYVAGDNDLAYFAGRNIEEMKKVGSSEHVNIIVQLDGQGAHEKTKRLYIEKGKATQVNLGHPSASQKLDFGNALTLIDCCKWAIEDYPAKHYALIFWNHGTGILDNIAGRATSASQLFSFNIETNMLELNRSIGYLDYLKNEYLRGVCFGDTYGTYLTNPKIKYALQQITQNLMNGKKIDIIGFDACLMGMIEVGNLIRPFSNYMIASQELELGTGWPYHKVLDPLTKQSLTPEQFSKHIVTVYHNNYKAITYDYTLSAIDLNKLLAAEENLDIVSHLLLKALEHQKNNTVSRLIKASRSKRLCTYFSEPTYIDLHHFLSNLLETVDFMAFEPEHASLKKQLTQALSNAEQSILAATCANECGKNLNKAKGISIYFPTRSIEPSYLATPFAINYAWTKLLKKML